MIKPKSRKHEDRIKALEEKCAKYEKCDARIVEIVSTTMRMHMKEYATLALKSVPWWKRLWL